MDDVTKQIVAVFTLIAGVAILAILVSRKSQTPQVIGSLFGGYALALQAAEAPVTGSSPHITLPAATNAGFAGFGGFDNLNPANFDFGSFTNSL